MNCFKCNAELKLNSFKFCPYCGADLSNSTDATINNLNDTISDAAYAEDNTKTVVQASVVPEDLTRLEEPAIAPDKVDDDLVAFHEAPTNSLSSVQPHKVHAASNSEPTAEESADDSDDDDKNKSFSETAWFMTAVVPEALADGEGEPTDFTEQDNMTERYEVEDKLPADVRKVFSLTMNQPVVAVTDEKKDK